MKAVDVNERSRMARFEQPIIAVKEVTHPQGSGKSPYAIAHISFQSIGSTNIQCVNALSEVMLYVCQQNRGRGDTERVWGIEMNKGCELYLKLYGTVDTVDQMLKDWGLDYVCWKWWYAPP